MEFKNINCPECGLNIEYWTKNDFIECPDCHNKFINLSCAEEDEEIPQDENETEESISEASILANSLIIKKL